MNTTRYGVERFPSLVEAAKAQREMSWREWAAHKSTRTGRPTCRRPSSVEEAKQAAADRKALASLRIRRGR